MKRKDVRGVSEKERERGGERTSKKWAGRVRVGGREHENFSTKMNERGTWGEESERETRQVEKNKGNGYSESARGERERGGERQGWRCWGSNGWLEVRRRERISASGKKNKHSRARREPAAAAAAAAALHHCAVRIYVAGKLEICGGRYPRATVYILDFFITALCRRCRRRGETLRIFYFHLYAFSTSLSLAHSRAHARAFSLLIYSLARRELLKS